MAKIGFIGTGLMGQGMVTNLLKAGHQVQVWNRTKEKALSLVEKGAIWTTSAQACSQDVDYVITIVGYPKDVEEVYFGTQGIFAGVSANTVLIDMTTTSPALATKIYSTAKDRGLQALDAPVSGGQAGAQSGQLAIMVGGEEEVFQKALPILEALGTNIVYEGPAGSGQHTKMANQIAIAGALAGVCEALYYAKQTGLDPEKTYQTIRTGAAGSFQMEAFMPKIIAQDFDATFYMKHFIKDLTIASEESQQRNFKLEIMEAIRQECQQVQAMGYGDQGTQALYHYYQA
ncbi:3-hydroxyisobutyrate dehydrogenase [Ligilactobacillus equi DSM 15833 = JCM 10991]|uniref:3-hydroxyisobutyrate dehydrogenase n=1 Tax=Ligilactobacillus equi DSM 15833 = JCM 10991 TaxID=1423740 RepID=A0A0R1TKV2_9LACO|nr:NAD(P)-dependent oxidoreductase [Ligilactobacillus equi]KRL81824.1 3-hydroxyisobutyrate dehydrogenase [Ligilactobacillus equi DSM 15833 = JCM 10991]